MEYHPMRILKLVLIIITICCLFGCGNRQDRADAQSAAERVNALIQKQDYVSIYNESGDDFKKEGEQAKFVAMLEAIYNSAGPVKKFTPIAYQSSLDTRVGRKHVLIYELQFEGGRGRERLEFTRNRNGEMRLWDLVIEPIQ